ncbi:MAG: hypothetical protein J6U16_02195 [Ruminococcus sp.]|nr:hypothetical protein [Ruminococcus sp.]
MSGFAGNEKLNKSFTLAELIFAGVFVLFFLLVFILTGSGLIKLAISLLWFIFPLFCCIRRKYQNFVACIAKVIVISPLLLFLSLFAPIMIKTHFSFRYPFQKTYISIYNGNDTFDYFPRRLPNGIKSYRLDYFPSILQGDGYTTISFKASDDVIQQYTNEYSKDAIFVCTVADLDETLSIRINENGSNTTNKYANVRMDSRFKAKCSDDAVVYIMYNSETSHRSSYTSAVVIDSEHNLIEFSKIG